MTMRYDALFLDADETIFDYASAERTAFSVTTSACGLQGGEGMYAAYRRYNSSVWKAFERGDISAEALKAERFRLLLADFGLVAPTPETMSAVYLDALSQQTQLLPGAEAAVAALAATWPLVLVTNGLTSVQRRRFAASPVTEHFSMILISEELGVAKPDPAIFATALARFDLDASRVLLVGDSSSSDMPAATNAGMDFCWVNPQDQPVPPGHAPRFIIHSLAELPALLADSERPS